jgi:zinc transport system ATP-binding protein
VPESKIVADLQDVTVTYQDHVVLRDITLQLVAGQYLAVIGPNGAGKTTLLKTILGTIRPASGTVRIFGKPPWKLGDDRSRIGYVPQITTTDVTFPITALEVVMMGRFGRIGLVRRPSQEDRDAVDRAMERVRITDIAHRPIGRLSGGQRQRVFVARALANDPELLLLDEPTTGVDIATIESFFELLHRLNQGGMAIMVVSHDIGVVARYADSIACVNMRLVAHGRPDEVLSGSVLACMYGPEAAYVDHGPIPHMVLGEHMHLDSEGRPQHG